MRVYYFEQMVIWYERRGRSWWDAPGHALTTAHANSGWRLSDYAAAQRISGYLVRPARPEFVAAIRSQRKGTK